MTKQIERLVKRFDAAQRMVREAAADRFPTVLQEKRYARNCAAMELSIAVSKHVAAQAKRKEKA